MDLALFVIAMCALGAFAMRFGRDSRDLGFRSDEHRLAKLGMMWDQPHPPTAPVRIGRPTPAVARTRPRRTGFTHAIRHPLAQALYRIAHWLAPEMRRATG